MTHQLSGPKRRYPTLRDEHALLLSEVQLRCRSVTAGTDIDHWPDLELNRLLDYLHVEVLRQVVDEQRCLFRSSHHAPQDIAYLRSEHLELRQDIERLTDAATGEPGRTPSEFAALTGTLQKDLQKHFRDEQALMGVREDGASTPATSALGSRPHEWYPYTAGPLIDLANLPGVQGADAILARLLQLGRGERVEIIAGSDPSALWRSLSSTDPDGDGFAYLEQGPELVVRRGHPPRPRPLVHDR